MNFIFSYMYFYKIRLDKNDHAVCVLKKIQLNAKHKTRKTYDVQG